MKSYKTTSPEKTVNRIRNILNDFGLLLLENHFINNEHYSCRVTIGNKGLMPLDIGTNGKGRNFEYSLASGYAEFAERLQNRLFFTSANVGKEFDKSTFAKNNGKNDNNDFFEYDINEKQKLIDDIDNAISDDLAKMCMGGSDNARNTIKKIFSGKDQLTFVPFYSVSTQNIVYMPMEYVLITTGSNGMAAGNSHKEAMLQAICEIFERYAMMEIYWNELTPPTIPIEYFKGSEIYNTLIKYQKDTGYKIVIKDCSLGKKLPVIGLLIIDQKRQLYNFKMGTDFVPSVALERCFTEMYQGRTEFWGLSSFIKTKNLTDEQYKICQLNYRKSYIRGMGAWPESIIGDSSSWKFTGFDATIGTSNKTDLQFSLNLIKKLGFNTYIRNNSILGFPAYYVVVPGMSQFTYKKPEEFEPYTPSIRYLIEYANNMGRMNQDMARKLFTAIDENYKTLLNVGIFPSHYFVYNVNDDLNKLKYEIWAILLAFYLNDYKNAKKYLDEYLRDKDKSEYGYYFACKKYCELKLESDSVKSKLTILYGEQLANEVISDLSDTSKIFQYYKLPNCPNCGNCSLKPDCRKHIIDDIVRKLREAEKKANIDQQNIKEYIENDEE